MIYLVVWDLVENAYLNSFVHAGSITLIATDFKCQDEQEGLASKVNRVK